MAYRRKQKTSKVKVTHKEYRLHFAECEHAGDLQMYAAAIEECGGTVTASGMIGEYETGCVCFTLQIELEKFKAEFAKTTAYLYSNIYKD